MKPEDWISSKDQRPQIGQLILAHHKSGSYWAQEIRSFSWEEDYDYWTPIVTPAKPDPFETWWRETATGKLIEGSFARPTESIKAWCQYAWNAALKLKEQGK